MAEERQIDKKTDREKERDSERAREKDRHTHTKRQQTTLVRVYKRIYIHS